MNKFKKELGQLFENNFDCYAAENYEEIVTMAMTKERFVEIVSRLVKNIIEVAINDKD